MHIKKTLLLCLAGAVVLAVCAFIVAKWYYYESSPAKLAVTMVANPEYLSLNSANGEIIEVLRNDQ